MINSIYSGASALNVLAQQHEIASQNLANVNTPGHRRFVLSVEGFNLHDGAKQSGVGPEKGDLAIDFSIGPPNHTGRQLDVSLASEGFFVLENGNQERTYTRDGRFFRQPESGLLINNQGLTVLGESGPIKIDSSVPNHQIQIREDGQITADGRELGKLLVAGFEDNQDLIPVGQTHFKAPSQLQELTIDPIVVQGSLEMSNANPVKELVGLIVGSRQYEAVQKATKSISDSLREHIRN